MYTKSDLLAKELKLTDANISGFTVLSVCVCVCVCVCLRLVGRGIFTDTSGRQWVGEFTGTTTDRLRLRLK